MTRRSTQNKGKEEIINKITEIAKDIYTDIEKDQVPKIESPIRSLSNVEFSKEEGYFKILGKIKERNLTVSSVKTFAQTLKMMSLSKKLIMTNDVATKRDAYYQSKGSWGAAGFKEQSESDNIIDDVEATLMVNREQLGFIPDEDGSAVSGNLIIIDSDPETGERIEIDCSKFGTGGYSIPNTVEHFKFKTNAKFILAVETSGMFSRLVFHKFWKKHNCILVSLKGVPSRATRRFIRKVSDEHNLPVLVFTDGDPYGYGNIYRTLKVGSGNAAHINKFFCVPKAEFIGVTPQDIHEYKLPTHPLKDIDLKKIRDLIKNDPFIKAHKEWQKALQQMAKEKRRVEQQAFAAHGLNYVIETYLPEKIKNKKTWLP